MANRVIDAVLKLTDEFTQPMAQCVQSMTNCSRSAQKIGKDITKMGDSITKMGAALTAGVTVPLVALAKTSYTEFGNVDKDLQLVKATMGDVKWEAGDLQTAIEEAARKSVYGMEDASAAAINFARQGFDAAEASAMLTPAMSLAAGTATDLSEVTGGLGNTMKIFESQGLSAAHAADVFATAQAQANTTTSDLIEAVSTAGPVFNTVGWSVEDLAAAIDVLGDAGISGSEAAHGLNTGLLRLSANDSATAMLDDLGVSIYNADGTMKSMVEVQALLHESFQDLTTDEKMQAASALFGANQSSKWLSLINAAPESLQAYQQALVDTTGSADSMADALMGGAGGAVENLSSAIDVAKYQIGEILGEYITPFIRRITDLVNVFLDADDAEKKQMVRLGAMAAAVGPAVTVFGTLVHFIGKGITAFNAFGGNIKKAGSLIRLIVTPASTLMIGLAGIAAAAWTIKEHWDVMQRSLAATSPVFQSIRQHVQNIVTKLSALWTVAGPYVQKIADFIGTIFTAAVGGALAYIATSIDTILAVFESAFTVLEGLWTIVQGIFTDNEQLVYDGVMQVFGGIADAMEAVFKGTINGVINIINGFLSGLNGISIPDWVPGLGGMSFNVPLIPTLAKGTDDWMGGIVQVSERGGEIIDLPKGSRVYPHDESVSMARAEGASAASNSASVTITGNTFNVRSDADIEAIGDAIVRKLKKANANRGGWTYSGAMA